jgi:hypothetical protein
MNSSLHGNAFILNIFQDYAGAVPGLIDDGILSMAEIQIEENLTEAEEAILTASKKSEELTLGQEMDNLHLSMQYLLIDSL